MWHQNTIRGWARRPSLGKKFHRRWATSEKAVVRPSPIPPSVPASQTLPTGGTQHIVWKPHSEALLCRSKHGGKERGGHHIHLKPNVQECSSCYYIGTPCWSGPTRDGNLPFDFTASSEMFFKTKCPSFPASQYYIALPLPQATGLRAGGPNVWAKGPQDLHIHQHSSSCSFFHCPRTLQRSPGFGMNSSPNLILLTLQAERFGGLLWSFSLYKNYFSWLTTFQTLLSLYIFSTMADYLNKLLAESFNVYCY